MSDGQLLSGSLDNTLRFWDRASGRCLSVLEGHNDWISSALELSKGRLLSRSLDETVRLWDSATGQCLAWANEDEAIRSHPEWLHSVYADWKPQTISSGFFIHYHGAKAYFAHRSFSGIICAWQAESNTASQCLQPDGTAVITQANGQVCFLKLYHGNRRISLAEAEELLKKSMD